MVWTDESDNSPIVLFPLTDEADRVTRFIVCLSVLILFIRQEEGLKQGAVLILVIGAVLRYSSALRVCRAVNSRSAFLIPMITVF